MDEWIEVKDVINRLALESLKIHIGDGEAASIILYREINADLLAINDLKARGVASAMGVHNYRNAGDITTSKGSRYA